MKKRGVYGQAKGRGWKPNSKGFMEVKCYAQQDLADDHEKSIGIGVEGRHFNIPTVVNGKQLKDEEAIKEFRAGRLRPLGQYSTQVEADREAGKRSRNSQKH